MKKKIIALSIAFILVAIAAIGTTLAYLTDNAGSVSNVFATGDITIDAVEYVNHTNAAGNTDKDATYNTTIVEEKTGDYAGYKKIALSEATGDSAAKYEYQNVIPGDKLFKKVEISNTSANPAIFAVTAKVTLPAAALTVGDWLKTNSIADTMPTAKGFIGVDKSTSGTYVFYYYLPGNTTEVVDLSAVVPVDVDNTTIASYNNTKIDVSVAAIQADGFATPADAIEALEDAMA